MHCEKDYSLSELSACPIKANNSSTSTIRSTTMFYSFPSIATKLFFITSLLLNSSHAKKTLQIVLHNRNVLNDIFQFAVDSQIKELH